MPDPVYYPTWISNHAPVSRGSALYFGPPCARLGEAKRLARVEYDAGHVTWACVVRVDGDGRHALPDTILPASAAKVVAHWLELLAALAEGPPENRI